MTRTEALLSLIRLDRPLDDLAAALRSYEWDWDGIALVHLDGGSVTSVIYRYLSGEITSNQVERWADMLEGREDVDFGPGVAEAIFDLANPALQGALTTIAPVLLNRWQ